VSSIVPTVQQYCKIKSPLEGWNTAVQRANERYWHKRLAETNQQTVWKVIRKHNTHYKPIPPLNGVSTFEGKCQVLRTALFPDPAIQIFDLAPDTILSKCDPRKEISAIASSKIWNTLKRCKTDTAPGPDQITYSTIRTFHSAVPAILPALFNAIYKYEIIPDEWKASNCVVIPKEEKSDCTVLTSYRPISMSACIGKIMESLTAWRLDVAAFRCGAMSRIQMGGTEHNSATDALIYTLTPMNNVLKIPPGKDRRIPPGSWPSLLTHDIEGAFNNTNPKILVQIMQQRQMPSYLVKWTQAFTINRTIAFTFDGQSEIPKSFTISIPQGSLGSPTFFAIVANAFLENPTIQCSYPASSSYIDDICMSQIGTRLEDIIPALKNTDRSMFGASSHN
jgi:hypothetical protein